jgi:pimeloyl-ACP methyl ester carboxylesterase
MAVQPKTVRSPEHPAAVRQVYQRMLRVSGSSGRFVTLGTGRRVYVVEAGDGPPVVHLHGNNTSALSHLMLLERTTAIRSYLVDRPGLGLSDPGAFPRERFRDFAVRFVDDILDALGLEDVVLVGASGGGIYATWYALEHSQRVRGLVMLGSIPTLPGGRLPLPIRLMAIPVLGDLMSRAIKPGRGMVLRMMAAVGEADTITRHPDLLDSLVAGARDPIAVAADRAEFQALISAFGYRRAMRIQPEDLRHLSVPTLMIWGDHDPVVPIEAARAAAQLIPDARLEVVPAGHVPQLGHPEQVAELLMAFARRHGWPAKPSGAQ